MPKIDASAAAQRRENILNAARTCFAEHGIHVSVDEICATAGISKGAFYGYFNSKDAAIQALAEDHGRFVHKLAEVDSLEALATELASLTTARSTDSSRLELETWTHALKLPPLCDALWRNIDELRQALATGVGRAAPGSERSTGLSDASLAEILSIFAMGLIAWDALGAESGARSGHTALRNLLHELFGDVEGGSPPV